MDLSALIVDNCDETRNEITKSINRISIPYNTVNNYDELFQKIKKSFFGKINYKIVIINYTIEKEEAFRIIETLRKKFDKRVTIFQITENIEHEEKQKFYQLGATMVVSYETFQSKFFNWYLKKSKGKLVNYDNKLEYNFNNKKVMVVEDNDINMEIALEFLEIVHIDAIAAYDGESAITEFLRDKDKKINLILMDVNMPGIDGYETTRRIRKLNDWGAKIPIIAVTANTLKEDFEEMKKSGMNGYVTKPVSTEVLYYELSKYITQK